MASKTLLKIKHNNKYVPALLHKAAAASSSHSFMGLIQRCRAGPLRTVLVVENLGLCLIDY